MENFLANIADILDAETELTPDMRLDTVEGWDSLTVVSMLAMINVEYGKTMRFTDFKGAVTFQDLYDIVQKHEV